MTQDATIIRLHADLNAAHQHIAALVGAIGKLDCLGEWVWSEADKATLLSIHLSETHNTELTDLMIEARTWLKLPTA